MSEEFFNHATIYMLGGGGGGGGGRVLSQEGF